MNLIYEDKGYQVRNTTPDLATTNHPRDVHRYLQSLATQYRKDQATLQDSWQDPQAGKVWGDLAKILEAAADKASAVCDKHDF